MNVLELHELTKENDDRKQNEDIELLVDEAFLKVDLRSPVHTQEKIFVNHVLQEQRNCSDEGNNREHEVIECA